VCEARKLIPSESPRTTQPNPQVKSIGGGGGNKHFLVNSSGGWVAEDGVLSLVGGSEQPSAKPEPVKSRFRASMDHHTHPLRHPLWSDDCAHRLRQSSSSIGYVSHVSSPYLLSTRCARARTGPKHASIEMDTDAKGSGLKGRDLERPKWRRLPANQVLAFLVWVRG
jgi:hypothetical protein